MANEDRIRLSSYGSGGATFRGLQPDEIKVLQGFTLGTCWARTTEEGRLEAKPRFEELPPFEEDPKIPPKWIPYYDWSKEASFLSNVTPPLPDEPDPRGRIPSLLIHSLCGYNKVSYVGEARKLQSYGFECLRSRRGLDGRMWELWYLSSTWCAKGELKDAISKITKDDAKQIETAITFLCRNVSFGALDVAYQKAAMVID